LMQPMLSKHNEQRGSAVLHDGQVSIWRTSETESGQARTKDKHPTSVCSLAVLLEHAPSGLVWTTN
jgi:hypothetical protein